MNEIEVKPSKSWWRSAAEIVMAFAFVVTVQLANGLSQVIGGPWGGWIFAAGVFFGMAFSCGLERHFKKKRDEISRRIGLLRGEVEDYLRAEIQELRREVSDLRRGDESKI